MSTWPLYILAFATENNYTSTEKRIRLIAFTLKGQMWMWFSCTNMQRGMEPPCFDLSLDIYLYSLSLFFFLTTVCAVVCDVKVNWTWSFIFKNEVTKRKA